MINKNENRRIELEYLFEFIMKNKENFKKEVKKDGNYEEQRQERSTYSGPVPPKRK